jgi:hypothetical protein
MNPFSKYLRQWSNDSQFEAFVDQWDRLERIVVGIYRGKIKVETAVPEFNQVWPWLRERYSDWAEALRPHWQATRAAGEPTHDDPFQLLLALPEPAAIRGDWRAMQHLPAAREAINRYLLAKERGTERG